MSLWDYRKNFAYDDPLNPHDPRLADLNQARGDYSRKRLLREFGLDLTANVLRDPCSGKYALFGGHRGCGKSTELREIAAELQGAQRYFVVQVDVQNSLDINNLSYADVALTLAEKLASDAAAAGISVDKIFLDRLHDWFKQVSRNTALENEASAELATGAEAKVGLPLIGGLFAKLTTAIRSKTTYKTDIRENVRNSFTVFAEAFNLLHSRIQEEIVAAGQGQNIIFIIDGTDRLSGDDADALFSSDIHQLRALRVNSIYCAPISVLNGQGQVAQNFDAVFRLPMVKLAEKGVDSLSQGNPQAWAQLRQFVTKRLPLENFDSPTTLDALIAHSGGHPRDLLRLVNLCFQELDEGPISLSVAEIAKRRLSNEYRRLVQPNDWALLREIDGLLQEIDGKPTDFTPATDQTRRLLYDLVLLEYNSYWWQSHPAVRALAPYQNPASPSTSTGHGSA